MAVAISHRDVYPHPMQALGTFRPLVTDYHVMGLPAENKLDNNNFISFSTPKNLFPNRPKSSPAGQAEAKKTPTGRQRQFQREQRSKSFPKDGLKSCCRGRTSPHRKSVRFADDFGKPLVREIAYSADDVELDDRIRKPEPVRRERFEFPKATANPPSPDSPRKVQQPDVVFLFAQPSSEPDFFTRVEQNNICLENIKREGPNVQGYIRVTNIAFNKKVTVRWTLNGWHSHQDLDCVYSHSIQDSHTDCFTFKLPLCGEQLELALHYHVDGKDYWDSNGGKNYRIKVKR